MLQSIKKRQSGTALMVVLPFLLLLNLLAVSVLSLEKMEIKSIKVLQSSSVR